MMALEIYNNDSNLLLSSSYSIFSSISGWVPYINNNSYNNTSSSSNPLPG
jgi:hypothetical protein